MSQADAATTELTGRIGRLESELGASQRDADVQQRDLRVIRVPREIGEEQDGTNNVDQAENGPGEALKKGRRDGGSGLFSGGMPGHAP